MREIKFRAWDCESKQMLTMPLTGNYGLSRFFGSLWFLNEYAKIMQYTGLKDKNGKEIYEGDIDSSRIVIEWDEDMAMWNLPRRQDESLLEYEIIGNKFEHPELLTKDKQCKK